MQPQITIEDDLEDPNQYTLTVFFNPLSVSVNDGQTDRHNKEASNNYTVYLVFCNIQIQHSTPTV